MPPLQAAGLLLAVAAFGGLGAQLGVGDIISDIIGKKINYRTYEPFYIVALSIEPKSI